MVKNYDEIPERHGQTDRQTAGRTDIIAISMSRVSVLTRDKNELQILLLHAKLEGYSVQRIYLRHKRLSE